MFHSTQLLGVGWGEIIEDRVDRQIVANVVFYAQMPVLMIL